jgi:hypothetical protein
MGDSGQLTGLNVMLFGEVIVMNRPLRAHAGGSQSFEQSSEALAAGSARSRPARSPGYSSATLTGGSPVKRQAPQACPERGGPPPASR